MSVEFRKVTLKQAKELLDLAKKTFIDTYEHLNDPTEFAKYIHSEFQLDVFQNHLANANNHYYFAYQLNKVVGYFRVLEYPNQTDLNDPDSLEIARFYILKEYKGKGTGSKMMQFIKSLCAPLSKKQIWLGIWQENHVAIEFYKKVGFIVSGTHSFMIGADNQKDYVMTFECSPGKAH